MLGAGANILFAGTCWRVDVDRTCILWNLWQLKITSRP